MCEMSNRLGFSGESYYILNQIFDTNEKESEFEQIYGHILRRSA